MKSETLASKQGSSEKFSATYAKVVSSPHMYTYVMRYIYWLTAVFWLIMALLNVYVAFKTRSELIIFVVMWLYFAYKGIKRGIEQHKNFKAIFPNKRAFVDSLKHEVKR